MAKTKAADFSISMDVLNSLAPQRGLMNAKLADLKDQTFILHSMAVNDPKKATSLTEVSEDNLFVKARYVNKATNKSFTVPIRGLLNLSVAEMGNTDNAKFVEKVTPTMKMHEHLLEKISGEDQIDVPKEFKIVDVQTRVQEGTENVMYPPFCYVAYNERVAEVRKSADYDGTLDSVFRDFDFMQALYAGPRETRHETAEPNKDLVITVIT